MPDKKQPSILILDPSSLTCQMLMRKLQKLGCDVHVQCSSGLAADTALDAQPDVILLELSFEDPSGFAICEAIKEDYDLRKIPIVIHTSRSTRQNVLRSIRAGACSVIVKPAATDTIVKKIHEVFVKMGRKDTFAAQTAAVSSRVGRRKLEQGATADKDQTGDAETEGSDVRVVFTDRMDAKSKLEALLRNAKEVKAMPHGVTRTLEVAQDEGSGAAELAKVIESDTAISTMVFKRANSVHYAAQKRTVKIKDAIVRIGFGETRNLVLSIAIVKQFNNDTNALGFQRGDFWEHSLAVGVLAKTLVRESRAVDPDLAFVAGLAHDLGKLLFDEYVSPDYESALEISGKKGVAIARAERDVFEINHTEVGHGVMERWRFPEILSEVALYHHSFRDIDAKLDPEFAPMVKLIYASNAIAKAIRLGGSGDEMLYDVPDELVEELKFPGKLPDDLVETVQRSVTDYREFLNVPPGDDTPSPHVEFQGKPLVLLSDPKPVVDTYDLYLSSGWGFEVRHAESLAALDQLETLDDAIVVLQAKDDPEDRKRYDKLFSHRSRGEVLLLLEPGARVDGAKPPQWPTDRVTTMRKPVDGRTLIATLSHVCQQTGTETKTNVVDQERAA